MSTLGFMGSALPININKGNIADPGAIPRGGAVLVFPPALTQGVGVVYAPDGSLISTAGTTTSGLQEAINYAFTNHCDLHIVGGSEPAASGIIYKCTTTLNFKSFEGASITSGTIVILFESGIGANDGVVWDSLAQCYIRLNALINYSGTGRAMLVKPTNVNLDGARVFSANYFFVNAIVALPELTSTGIAVEFDSQTNRDIAQNFMVFPEINGGNIGIKVSGNAFSKNFVWAPNLHSQNTALTGDANPIVLIPVGSQSNEYHLDMAFGGASKTGIYLEGQNDLVFFATTGGTPTVGCKVGTAARKCALFPKAVNGGLLNVATIKDSQAFWPPERVITSITVGASPFAYQNADLQAETVLVQGGTVSVVAIGWDGTTYHDTGETNGVFFLQPGQYIRVTYTGVPTMTKHY